MSCFQNVTKVGIPLGNEGLANFSEHMSEKTMFYGAPPVVFEKARQLRNNMTKHETIISEQLKGNKILGLRFKAQHPIHKYVVDFYCHKIKLAIEIDGENHQKPSQLEYDVGRTEDLNNFGIHVMRFTNLEVESNLENVVEQIRAFCET